MRISDWSSDVCSSDLKISASIAPDFNEWNQKNLSMREIAETGPEKVVKAVRAGPRDLIIINVQSVSRNHSNPQIFQPPVLKPALEGPIQLFFSNPANPIQKGTINVPPEFQQYVDVDLTKDLITAKLDKVTIGGVEIPIE